MRGLGNPLPRVFLSAGWYNLPESDEPLEFDEEWYLRQNPDIACAVQDRRGKSGLEQRGQPLPAVVGDDALPGRVVEYRVAVVDQVGMPISTSRFFAARDSCLSSEPAPWLSCNDWTYPSSCRLEPGSPVSQLASDMLLNRPACQYSSNL
jgi:hypothetical protein